MKELKQLLADKRIRRTSESPPRFSIVDAISIATALNGNGAAREFRRLRTAYPAHCARIANVHFSGEKQRPTPVCEAAELENLFAVLPGKAANVFRVTGEAPTKRKGGTIKDHLYIMRYSFCSTAVKIGRSGDVEKRRMSLEAGQNFHVEIVATFPGKGFLEAEVHKALEDKRSKIGAGTEWFDLAPEEALVLIGSFCR